MNAPAILPSLLWAVQGGLERAYIKEGARDDRMPSLDLWANLLRALDNVGTDRRELPVILRLSMRALRSRVSAAARHGWVEELQSGRGQVKVRLTARGSDVTTRWKSLQRSAEERWRAEIGVSRTDRLRASLEQLVAALPLEHPTTRPAMERRTQASRAATDWIGNQCTAVTEILSRAFLSRHWFPKPWLPSR